MTTLQMDELGRRYVTAWLSRSGYKVDASKETSSRPVVTADGPCKVFVRVCTVVFPDEPPRLTDNERLDLALDAAMGGRKAFAALVTLAQGGPLYKDIEWIGF